MPTPYGPHGGMAFSADELRVLRRALAIALHPHPAPALPAPDREEQVRDCLRLAEAVDEAVHEGGRMRAFQRAELARYRAALPGAAVGYLDHLRTALVDGYDPRPEDLAALRTLCESPSGAAEAARRGELLSACRRLTERSVRARLVDRARLAALPRSRTEAARQVSLPRRAAAMATGPGEPRREPAEKPETPPGERKHPGDRNPPPSPGRPVPTPAEVFPPKRRPARPPESLLVRTA